MDSPQVFWKIFQSILRSLQPAQVDVLHSEGANSVSTVFRTVLNVLGYASPFVSIVMAFIDLAYWVYRWVKSTFFTPALEY